MSDKRSLCLDYHVEVEDHYYSVPYRFGRRQASPEAPGIVHTNIRGPRYYH